VGPLLLLGHSSGLSDHMGRRVEYIWLLDVDLYLVILDRLIRCTKSKESVIGEILETVIRPVCNYCS